MVHRDIFTERHIDREAYRDNPYIHTDRQRDIHTKNIYTYIHATHT